MALTPKRMPHDVAFSMSRNLKRALAGLSMAGFFSFLVLASGNRVGVTSPGAATTRPTTSQFFGNSSQHSFFGTHSGVSSPARGTTPLTSTVVS